jgi:rubrerythrin
MNEVNWINEVIDFAIDREIEANEFYIKLSKQTDNPAMRKAFEDFAKEELGHKAKLEAFKQGELTIKQDNKTETLNWTDYLVGVEPKPDMSYSDALILAMKKEKASYRLYMDLAAIVNVEEATEMFMWLANEEAKHKLRFEIEYDDVVMRDN